MKKSTAKEAVKKINSGNEELVAKLLVDRKKIEVEIFKKIDFILKIKEEAKKGLRDNVFS